MSEEVHPFIISPGPGMFFIDIGLGGRYNGFVNMGVFLCLADGEDAHRLVD